MHRHDGHCEIESCNLGITSMVEQIRSEGIIGGGQFYETFKWYPAQLCVRVMIWDLNTLHFKESRIWNFHASSVRRMGLSALWQIPILTSSPTTWPQLFCAYFSSRTLYIAWMNKTPTLTMSRWTTTTLALGKFTVIVIELNMEKDSYTDNRYPYDRLTTATRKYDSWRCRLHI